MTVYVSKVTNYSTDRLANMTRHLLGKGYRFSTEDDSFFEYCETYPSESEYAKATALRDRNKAPKTLDMDITPYLMGRIDEIMDIDGIYAKFEEISNEIENQKYEQVITKFFGNQMTYSDGWLCHIGGEIQPTDTQYYNLYKSIAISYGHYLYNICSQSKCDKYRTQICKRSMRLAEDKTTKPVITKRIKKHIEETM